MGKESKEKNGGNKQFYVVAGLVGQVTLLLVVPVVGFLILGLWLDSFFHTTPLFLILGVVLGFAGSIVNVFRMMKMLDKG